MAAGTFTTRSPSPSTLLVIQDAFESVGGNPCIGRRFGSLLTDAGFERVQLTPGYGLALSSAMWTGRPSGGVGWRHGVGRLPTFLRWLVEPAST